MEWHSFRKRKLGIIVPIVYLHKWQEDVLFSHIVENGWINSAILKENYDKVGQLLFNELSKDKNYIKKRLKENESIDNNFIIFFRSNLSKDLKNYSNERLLKLLEKYYDFYQKFSMVTIPSIVFLADKLPYYLIKKLNDFIKEDINKVFTILSTPNVLTYTKKEGLAVLSLAIDIKEKRLTNFKNTDEFKRLVDNYFWIPFDYFGPEIWDEKEYAKRINELLSLEIDVLKQKKENSLQYQKNLEIKQKELIKELKLPSDLIDLFEALKDIAILQDKRKAIASESHYYLQMLYKELANRTNMDYLDFYFFLDEEIKDVLINSKDIRNIVNERKKLSISIVKSRKIKILYGNEARNYAKENNLVLPSQESEEGVNEFKGTTGSQGNAVGEIRIIESPKEMFKFKKGEILVSPMTSPDYVPIMGKAKAIITNEGGLTSHAAIVSRELGIPCIVGTRIATKVLKDGDLVEVKANEGIVKIIRKK